MLRMPPRQLPAAPADDAVTAVLLGQLGALNATWTAEQVDGLEEALRQAVKHPTPALGSALREQLDRAELSHLRLSDGRPLRSALVSAQQALGFPWALEIAPEDLWMLRGPSRQLALRAGLMGAALLSGAWSALWALNLLDSWGPWTAPLAAVFVAGMLHAAAAVTEAIAFRSARRLEHVGRAWVLAPLVLLSALGMWGMERPHALLLLVAGCLWAAPPLLTALLALMLSRRLKSREGAAG